MKHERTDYEQLEKRVAALEKQLEDGTERKITLDYATSCLILMIMAFAEDFNVHSPEINKMLDELSQKVQFPERP